MGTASRRSQGQYTTLYTNVIERYVNENRVEDLVFLATPLLAAFQALGKVKPLPADLNVRISEDDSENSGDSFEYYDTVSTATIKGAQAARFGVANYSYPLTISWQEEMEFTSNPDKIADHLEFQMEKQTRAMAQRIAKDIYRGNIGNSTNIVGLEQMLPDISHVDSAGGGAAATDKIERRFQMRQATNTYGGITRSAWADDDTPGSYWEGNSADFGGFGDLGFTSGQNDASNAQQRFDDAYGMLTFGMDMPDLMVSSYAPYRSYENGALNKQQITRGAGSPEANISFSGIKYKNAIWFWDDFCKTYTVQGQSTAGNNNVYMLTSRHLEFHTDERANVMVTEPRTPTNQHAYIRHLVWRGQLFTKNPRHQGRIFDILNS